ncbi:putative tetratricopeptide-like helical domain superfamily [Helianthus debilis subsp. tardiflorus]
MDLCAISVLRCTVVFNLTKTGFNSHIYTATALTDMYMNFKHQFLYSALKVFDEITEPNTTSINVVVFGFCQNGCYKKAFEVFKLFSEFKLRPDWVTVASLLSGCDISVKDGQLIHCWAVKIGVETDIYVATSLNRIAEPVFKVFKQMLRRSAHDANTVTFVSVLSACSDNKNFKFGLQVHGLLVKVDLVLNLLVGTAHLDIYSKCRYWHRAYDVFKEMREIRSLITWNSMIFGMMLNGKSESAIGLFMMLESNGLKPDPVTWINNFPHVLYTCVVG